MIQLLTKQEIKKAGRGSKKLALEFSIKHWHQILSLTLRQYTKAGEDGKIAVGSSWCSLCHWGEIHRHGESRCHYCPLGDAMYRCGRCYSPYRLAVAGIETDLLEFVKQTSNRRVWSTETKKAIKQLLSVMESIEV